MTATSATAGEIVLVGTPTAEVLLGAVARCSANRLYRIPAIWGRILEADLDRFDLSSLRTVDTSTSAPPPELLESLRRQFPTRHCACTTARPKEGRARRWPATS